MLKTFDLRGRERPLAIHGPPGLGALLSLVLRMAGRVGFELTVVEVEPGDVLARDGYRIAPVAVAHRGPALGYALFEDVRPGVFDPERAVALGLQPGPEFGRVQRGETIRDVRPDQVMGEPRPGRKIVLSGDTTPCRSLQIAAHRADVLVHEATFAEEERERADETGHSTAAQAATIARDAEVTMLALNHVSMRHPVGVLRAEAREVFARTVIPRDFDTIEIPFAERGRACAGALGRPGDDARGAPGGPAGAVTAVFASGGSRARLGCESAAALNAEGAGVNRPLPGCLGCSVGCWCLPARS